MANIPTLGWVNLTHAQSDVYSFTATGASSQIVVRQGSSSTVPYYLDQVELIQEHLYDANLVMSADYYPFGMTMPGRNINAADYRYAYNGMEQDNEVKGNGNSYTTEFRQYDPRLGRWLSLDPLMMMFPDVSPYCAFDNNPVFYTDPYGLEPGGPPGAPSGTPELTGNEKEGQKSADGNWEVVKGDDGNLFWSRTTIELDEVVITADFCLGRLQGDLRRIGVDMMRNPESLPHTGIANNCQDVYFDRVMQAVYDYLDCKGLITPPAPTSASNSGSDAVHTVLDALGLIPVIGEVFDILNAAVYIAEGDIINAGISSAEMVPVFGSAGTGGR